MYKNLILISVILLSSCNNYSDNFKVVSLAFCENNASVKMLKGLFGNDVTNKICQCSYEKVVNTLSDEDKKYILNGGKGLFVDPIISKFENNMVVAMTSCIEALKK